MCQSPADRTRDYARVKFVVLNAAEAYDARAEVQVRKFVRNPKSW